MTTRTHKRAEARPGMDRLLFLLFTHDTLFRCTVRRGLSDEMYHRPGKHSVGVSNIGLEMIYSIW